MPYVPVGTLRESGFEGVGAGALDHVDECPRVENDLSKWEWGSGGASHSNVRSGDSPRISSEHIPKLN